LAKMKKEFIEGAIEHSDADRKSMEKFWAQLEDFAAYCFNKVHSACYAQIAYQTAYLKAHFPDAFMAALMTSDYDNTDRLTIEITECKHMGIEVLPPDVNESFHEFGVVPGEKKIRFGLDAIKNVGHGAADEILRAREEAGGKFTGLSDYCRLVSCHIVNRKALESLVKSGALDCFGPRLKLFGSIDKILGFSSRLQKDSAAGQVGLFGEKSDELAPVLQLGPTDEAADMSLQLGWERELLGLYLSYNPQESYEPIITGLAQPVNSVSKQQDGRAVILGGCLNQIREITTKSGTKMAFATLADASAEIEAVIFPKLYTQTATIWQRDNFILAKGTIDYSRSEEPKFLIEKAVQITENDAREYQKDKQNPKFGDFSGHAGLKQRLYIRLQDSQNQPLLLTLKEKLDGHRGSTEVVLVTGDSDQKQIIKLPQTVSINEQSLRELATLFGSTNVVVR
jgi:DNA polymerase III subunit alpha